MKTTQPEKTLIGVQVYDIEYLAVVDPDYRQEYASDYGLEEEDIVDWINDLETQTKIYFDLTQEELDDCEDTDEFEDVLIQWIEDNTGEYFVGYNWEFVYQEDLAVSE